MKEGENGAEVAVEAAGTGDFAHMNMPPMDQQNQNNKTAKEEEEVKEEDFPEQDDEDYQDEEEEQDYEVEEQDQEDEEDEDSDWQLQEHLEERKKKRKKKPVIVKEEENGDDKDPLSPPPKKVKKLSQRQKRRPRRVKGVFEIVLLLTTKHWQCRACPFRNKDRRAALDHLRLSHMTRGRPGDKKGSSSMDLPVFPCDRCPGSYRSQTALRRHMKLCHDPPSKSQLPEPGGPFPCTECTLLLPSQQALANHNKTHKPILQCRICTDQFKNQKALDNHQSVCVLEMDCIHCGTVLRRLKSTLSMFRQTVKRHETLCAEKTDFDRTKHPRCIHCNKQFQKRYNACRHMMTCSQNPANRR